jgi:predicted deacylase
VLSDPVELAAPDLLRHPGNTGISHVWSFAATAPGPHVVVTALLHGNELAGALAVLRLLDADVRPERGRLSLLLANTAACARFDPGDPRATRFLDEDMNRLWSRERLAHGPDSVELRRARELLPVIESADLLLDLHSMQTQSPPLMLATMRTKGLRLAARVGLPRFVIADAGHANGTRLIDFAAFGDAGDPRTAILLEAGEHWRLATAETAYAVLVRFLEITGALTAETARRLAPAPRLEPQVFVEVTQAVTVDDDRFRLARDFAGLEILPAAGTPIAETGAGPVVTPYDDCVLVMPTRRLQVGLTAVRLGRIVPGTLATP